MTLILSGSDGLSDVDGSAATPAIRGTDANTGIFFPAADTIAFSEGGVEAARFDSSGNLGIGTTSPSVRFAAQKASGAGTVGSFSDGTAGVDLAVTATGGSVQAFDTNQTIDFKTFGTGTLNFFTNNTERARIDSSGNLLVGTTTALNSGAKINAFNTSGGNGGLAIGYGSGAAANRVIYLISSNGGLYFESSANAALLNSAGAWTNASDARLKNSITDIKYGLSAVMDTQPRSYKMNDLEGDYFGFIAQELQTVLPEVISGDPEKQLGVDYGSLVAVAFKAIQEQQALIIQLQADVAALKAV